MSPKESHGPFDLYRFLYRMRVLLMAPLFYVMVFCLWHEYENDLVTFTVGPAIFLAGMVLRVWGQMHLCYRLKTKTRLTTTGPYRYVRNPLYIGNTIILAGTCFMSELIWFIPVVIAYCGVLYTLVVKYEEGHLAKKYGEAYLAYVRQVPRWIPRFRPGTVADAPRKQEFLYASLLVEARNLLLVVLPVAKEIFIDLS